MKNSKDCLEGKEQAGDDCPTMQAINNEYAAIKIMWYYSTEQNRGTPRDSRHRKTQCRI